MGRDGLFRRLLKNVLQNWSHKQAIVSAAAGNKITLRDLLPHDRQIFRGVLALVVGHLLFDRLRLELVLPEPLFAWLEHGGDLGQRVDVVKYVLLIEPVALNFDTALPQEVH